MIKAEELRIGNWVTCVKANYTDLPGKPFKVSSISQYIGVNAWQDMGANGNAGFEDLMGIPLTAELLEKCGFETQYNHNSDGDEIEWLQNGDIKFRNDEISVGWSVLPHIKYLHQLQNLYFALTGEELKFDSCQTFTP